MLLPNAVFTPGRPPVEATNVYVSRGQAQRDLEQALSRSMIPIVFGEYGVGKTSLARNAAKDFDQRGKLVNIESVADKTFDAIVAAILEHVGYTVETTRQTAAAETKGEELSGTTNVSFFSVTGKKTNGSSNTETRTETLVVTSPTDSRILDLCEQEGLALMLDELHRASAGFLKSLSSFYKAYHNRPCTRFKLLLVGTVSDATRLVEQDPGIDRIVEEIALKGMTQTEASSLVHEGMAKLAIAIDPKLVERIAAAAAGSPSLVQFLALEIAEAAYKRSSRTAEDADLDIAIKEYVRKRAGRLNTTYVKAIETTGAKKYRKQVLHAMARASDDFVTMEDLVALVSTALDEDIPSTALSGPLRDLKTPQYGNILKDVERSSGGARVYNYSTFTDPSMKAFIRFRHLAEEQGLSLETPS